jgi:hypothetical protein
MVEADTRLIMAKIVHGRGSPGLERNVSVCSFRPRRALARPPKWGAGSSIWLRELARSRRSRLQRRVHTIHQIIADLSKRRAWNQPNVLR